MSTDLAALNRARAADELLQVSRAARALLADAPELGAGWGEVAQATLEAGDTVACRKAARHLTEALPGDPQSWLWLASAEAALGNFERALEIVRDQMAGQPGDPGLNRRAGRLLLELGRPAEAEACYRTALRADQSDTLAWEGLSQCKQFARGDDDIADMEEWRLGLTEAVPADRRALLSYALAKAYTDIGEHDVAARRVWEAAAFYRASTPFNVDDHKTAVHQICRTYDERFKDAKEESGVIDSRPVFIVAPPAAGASWLGRILSAAPDVARLERDNALFWMSASSLGNRSAEDLLSAYGKDGDPSILTDVARTYLSLAEERVGSVRRWIDCSSVSELAVGAIALALPAARFVQIGRTPRDLAWACFSRRFRRARFWTYHADDVAQILATHDQLVAHWNALFGERFLMTTYEALATNTEDEVRRIAFFAGVDPDAAAAAAQNSTELFETDPVGVHKRAGARFDPLEAALQRAGLVAVE